MEDNLARKKEISSLESATSRNIPEGWMRTTRKPQNEKIEKEIRKSSRGLDDHWKILEEGLTYVMENEEWLSTNWLEKSSLEEQRLRIGNYSRSKKREGGGEQMRWTDGKVMPRRGTGTEYKRNGKFQEGILESMGGRADDGNEREKTESIDAEETTSKLEQSIPDGRKTTNQVEECLTVETLHEQKIVEFEFGRFKDKFYKVDKTASKKKEDATTEKIQKDVRATHGWGKMRDGGGDEMHATAERKCASQKKSGLLSLERSPVVGMVMKKKLGTPTRRKKFESLRKIFEITSSPTKRVTELLLQSSGAIFNLNPETTTRCERLDTEICVGQSEGGTQTGPRQRGGMDLQPSCDWPCQTSLEPVGPTRGEVPEMRIGEVKK